MHPAAQAPAARRRGDRPSGPGPDRSELYSYLATLAGNDLTRSLLEVRYRRHNGGMRRRFYPTRQLDECVALIIQLGQRVDVYVGVAPRTRPFGAREAIKNVWCLWADIDGPKATRQLERFAPAPAMVIASGSPHSVHAYWPLRTPLGVDDAEGANRRLAHAFQTDAVWDAPRILRPLSVARRIRRSVCPARSFADASPSEAVIDGKSAR